MILVISSKKVYAAKRLQEEAGIRNYELVIMDVADLAACDFVIDIKKFDVLYVRDPYLNGRAKYIPRIIALAKRFKAAEKKVVDSAIAKGQLGQGKWADYQKLRKAGLPIPETKQLSDFPLSTFHFPLIFKWTYGFKAKNVFLVKNNDQLKKLLPLHPKNEWLIQEYLRAEYEYKVITIGYKALPVVLRFKIKDSGFRTDFRKADVLRSFPLLLRRGLGRGCGNSSLITTSLSSKANNNLKTLGDVSPQEERTLNALISLSESAAKALKRELAKVDILEAKGKFYILEVNRFPGLKSFEELTKYNVSKKFLDYLAS